MSELCSGAHLQGGKYKIEKSLGQGGFGITYLAEQTNLGRKVCIKEFFMKEYGERTASPDQPPQETVLTDGASSPKQAQNDNEATVLTGVSAVTSAAAEIMRRYREKFVKEARTIARLDHPGIVRIHDVFEENGTAYYVMDFIEGENLNDMVKHEGPLSEDRALSYIRQIADALSYVHGYNIMHLDVKPANVLVRKSDDKAILIDFGTAKQYDSEGTQTSTTPIGLSAGYAPIEMNKPGGVQAFSPETDVYSLGATLYYLVTGQNPLDASERMEMIMEGEKFQLPASISSTTAEVIEQSMQTRKKRIQTVNEFLELLNSNGEKKCLEAEEKAAKEAEAMRQEELCLEREKAEAERKQIAEDKKKQTGKRVIWWILGSVAAVILLLILINGGSNSNDSSQLTPEGLQERSGSENGHEWIDLGLSVKWASCNIGADSPEQAGDYVSWGEVGPKKVYSEENHMIDYLLQAQELDAASFNWGGSWRIPSKEEFQELLDKCDIKWTTKSGMPGIECIGINKNSIFLPAAGYKSNLEPTILGTSGFYWSSTQVDACDSFSLVFTDPEQYNGLGDSVYISGFAQYNGCVIRPVIE